MTRERQKEAGATISISSAAKFAERSEADIRALIQCGELAATRCGRRYSIDVHSFALYLCRAGHREQEKYEALAAYLEGSSQ